MNNKKRGFCLRKKFKTIVEWCLSKIRRFWDTSLLALFFLLCSYIFSNSDLAFVDDNNVLKWLKIAQYELLSDDEVTEMPDSVIFVNTCYDNSLIEARDSYGRPIGTLKITNRKSLVTLLDWLKTHDNYRYVMLDVGITTLDKTEYDDSLYNLIADMPRFAMAKLDTLPIDPRIKDKCYETSYKISAFNSDCVKYPAFIDGKETLPYRAFTDITGRSISKVGPFYFEGGHLARRSIYPNYSLVIRKQYSNDANSFFDESKFYNIESGILKSYTIDEAKYLFDDKVIVIGDFDDKDMHPTYVGTLAGPLIQYNVLTSLMHNSHQIPYYLLLFLYVIFFLISDNLLHKRVMPTCDETERSFKLSNSVSRKIVPIALLSTYYSILLIVLCALIYIITGQAYDIMFTGVLIGIAHWIIRISNKKKSNKI